MKLTTSTKSVSGIQRTRSLQKLFTKHMPLSIIGHKETWLRSSLLFHLHDGLRAIEKHKGICQTSSDNWARADGGILSRPDAHVHGISKKKKWNKTTKRREKTDRFIIIARMDSNAYLFHLVVLIFTANCILKNNFISIIKNFAIFRLTGEPALWGLTTYLIECVSLTAFYNYFECCCLYSYHLLVK